MLSEERKRAVTRGGLLLSVLNWVLKEQLEGRSPASVDVAQHFSLTVEEAEYVREKLESIGELS